MTCLKADLARANTVATTFEFFKLRDGVLWNVDADLEDLPSSVPRAVVLGEHTCTAILRLLGYPTLPHPLSGDEPAGAFRSRVRMARINLRDSETARIEASEDLATVLANLHAMAECARTKGRHIGWC
jgi:hypothetical protein